MSTNIMLTSWGIDPYTGTLQEINGKLLDSAYLPYCVELAMRRLGMIIDVPLDDSEEIHLIEIINPKLTRHFISLLEVIANDPRHFLRENRELHSPAAVQTFVSRLDVLHDVVIKKHTQYATIDCVTLHIG